MRPTTTIKVNMLVSMHLMLNVVSWSRCPFSSQLGAEACSIARNSSTLQLNLRSWPLSLRSSGSVSLPMRAWEGMENGNSWACWPCSHGEHCSTVKAGVRHRLCSGLVFVSGPTRPTERLFDSAAAPWRHWLFALTRCCFIISSHRNGICLLFNLDIRNRGGGGGGGDLIHTA